MNQFRHPAPVQPPHIAGSTTPQATHGQFSAPRTSNPGVSTPYPVGHPAGPAANPSYPSPQGGPVTPYQDPNRPQALHPTTHSPQPAQPIHHSPQNNGPQFIIDDGGDGLDADDMIYINNTTIYLLCMPVRSRADVQHFVALNLDSNGTVQVARDAQLQPSLYLTGDDVLVAYNYIMQNPHLIDATFKQANRLEMEGELKMIELEYGYPIKQVSGNIETEFNSLISRLTASQIAMLKDAITTGRI